MKARSRDLALKARQFPAAFFQHGYELPGGGDDIFQKEALRLFRGSVIAGEKGAGLSEKRLQIPCASADNSKSSYMQDSASELSEYYKLQDAYEQEPEGDGLSPQVVDLNRRIDEIVAKAGLGTEIGNLREKAHISRLLPVK